jgi:hypothetical protein
MQSDKLTSLGTVITSQMTSDVLVTASMVHKLKQTNRPISLQLQLAETDRLIHF